MGGAAEGELERIGRRGDVDGAHGPGAVLGRREAGAELGRGLADRRGRSPRGQVRFASSNSLKGFRPTFSGCSITDMRTGSSRSLGWRERRLGRGTVGR